eukprot:scaffold10563_cov113-Isochrysis_galbana.AAC.2
MDRSHLPCRAGASAPRHSARGTLGRAGGTDRLSVSQPMLPCSLLAGRIATYVTAFLVIAEALTRRMAGLKYNLLPLRRGSGRRAAGSAVLSHFFEFKREKRKTYFWFSMEQTPADARAAPSASAPNDTVMDIHASPKRPREQAQSNMVSQRATTIAPLWPESQSETTVMLSRAAR